MDNQNMHESASLYKVFSPAETRWIMKRLEIHYIQKYESWLGMAEIELKGDDPPMFISAYRNNCSAMQRTFGMEK